MSKGVERILGVDPGFGRTGFGVIEKRNNEWSVVVYGCIETSIRDPYSSRLEELHEELKQIIKKYHPTRAAVEDLFFYKNITTAIKVGQARGVILLTLKQASLRVDEFTPLQVKQCLTGYGKAEKAQVEKMIKLQFGLKKKIRPDDAADALAIAFTAANALKIK